jgi:hypothetical protein
LRTRTRLTEATRDWKNAGRDPAYLYTGARLAVAKEWEASHPGQLSTDEAEFLTRSLEAKSKREASELEAAQHLALTEAARAAEAQRAEEAEKKIAGLMSTLKTALTSYAKVEMAKLGGPETSGVEFDNLRKDLKQVIRANNGIFAICVVMLLVLFGVQLWVTLTQPQLVIAAAGVFGISAAGLIFQMIQLWREKVATEILLGLIPVLDPPVLRTVINALIKKIK